MMEDTHKWDILLARGWGAYGEQRDIADVPLQTTENEGQELWRYADLHQVWGVLYEGLRRSPEIRISRETEKRFSAAAKGLAYQYYSILSLTTYVLDILKKKEIACYVLKGVPLNAIYPREEMRKLADADIYVPDRRQFRQAEKLMEANGFRRKKDLSDFHTVYEKNINGGSSTLELHWRPCEKLDDAEAEKAVEEIFRRLEYRPEFCIVAGMEIPVLPATENAFQILLHMLQHFLHEGFGMRLLCDWCVLWSEKGTLVDEKIFLEYLQRTGLEGFAWAVTRICVSHLKLDPGKAAWMEKIDSSLYGDSDERLYLDILEGGEFGRGDSSRMLIFKNESSLFSAFREVHKIARARFPQIGKFIFLWPFLWGWTIWIFLVNTKTERRSSAGDIIKNARERKKLVKQMRVFDNKR